MKKATVADVMTRTVITAGEDTPFKEIARLMAENGVRGIPVLGEGDQVVGVVSEEDLLRALDGGHSHLEWLIDGRRGDLSGDVNARDLMSTEVVSIGPDQAVDEAARVMLRNGITRLPVLDEANHMVGIVTRTDLLRRYLRNDEAIRQEIEENVILETMWIDPSTIQVTVEEGVVTLEGQVETKSTKELLVELVRRIDGVIGLEDRLSFAANDRRTSVRPPQMVGFGFGRGTLTGSTRGGL
jgi:CBS domain-containing protein